MCNDSECRWICIIEDEKTGNQYITHYKFNSDMTFEELHSEGDIGLKIYAEVLRDKKYSHSQPANIVTDLTKNLIVLDGLGNMEVPEDDKPPKLTILEECNNEILNSVMYDLEKS